MLLWRMNKATADPVEETDDVLGAKLCGSTTTLSVGMSYLASESFIVFFRFLVRTWHQITPKRSNSVKSPPTPAKRPISSSLKTGSESEDAYIGSVRDCDPGRVAVRSGPAKDYKIQQSTNERSYRTRFPLTRNSTPPSSPPPPNSTTPKNLIFGKKITLIVE